MVKKKNFTVFFVTCDYFKRNTATLNFSKESEKRNVCEISKAVGLKPVKKPSPKNSQKMGAFQKKVRSSPERSESR